VVDVGVTVRFELVAPVFQEYVLAPLAVTVATWPGQIVALVAVTVGPAATVTVAVADLLHPAVFVPVTVYTACEVGATVALALEEPVLHE
jgi:hypothetical protein